MRVQTIRPAQSLFETCIDLARTALDGTGTAAYNCTDTFGVEKLLSFMSTLTLSPEQQFMFGELGGVPTPVNNDRPVFETSPVSAVLMLWYDREPSPVSIHEPRPPARAAARTPP